MEVLAIRTIDENVNRSWSALDEIAVTQFLHHDKRPVFVLDLQDRPSNTSQPIPIAFANPALKAKKPLFDFVNGCNLGELPVSKLDRQAFLNWIRRIESHGPAVEFQFAGFTWSCVVLEAQWGIFVANENHCTCTVSRSETLSEAAPVLPQETVLAINKIKNAPPNRFSQLDGETSSTSSRNPNPLARARNFFSGSLLEKDPGISGVHSASERKAGTDMDQSECSTLDRWSDIRIAKRNADFLAKISAFDTIGISIANNEGDILFANDAWYKICKLAHGPADATSWMDIFEEVELSHIVAMWERLTIQQEPLHFQSPLKWRWNPPPTIESGPREFPVWISVWAYPDVSPDGETIGCCSVVTDISQQKWTELVIEKQLAEAVERAKVLEQLSKDLTSTETRFRRISDSMPHGIFMCNKEGNMLYANPAYHEIFPGAKDPSTPEPWWDNVPEDELVRGMEVWRKLREEHVKVSFEMSFLKTSKSASTVEHRYMAVSAYPELDDGGKVKHIIGCITDISYLKVAEQTQAARADDAEKSKRQLEHFIDMTSHEIRNPLSAIVHSAEEILSCLRSYPEGLTAATIGNAIDTMETIMDCTSHSTRIVDDILVVSKLESGLLTITPTVVQLVPAVKQALKIFDGELRANNISQSLTIDQSFKNLKLDCRVLQVLVNLVTNAIKFTRPEKVRRIDTCLAASLKKPTSDSDQDKLQYLPVRTDSSVIFPESASTQDEVIYISISVADTGCGLSKAEQKNLFQRFSQAGKRTHVKYGGTGLGSFISRQLCEMQGGQIGLLSTPSEGSVFTFYVKALRSKSQAPKYSSVGLRIDHQAASTPSAVPSASSSQHQSNVSLNQAILLVEDNLVNQKVVAKMLRSKGFAVLVANHGLGALEHIRNSSLSLGALAVAPPISLVLLDIEMPVMDGLSCVRHICKMEDLGEVRCHIPVVAVTANARKEQIDQAREAGMDDIVTKPFRKNQLLTVMTQLWKQYPV